VAALSLGLVFGAKERHRGLLEHLASDRLGHLGVREVIAAVATRRRCVKHRDVRIGSLGQVVTRVARLLAGLQSRPHSP